jgi:hypothetical protein
MAKVLETVNGLFAKLPFKGLAEKLISEGARAKVPFLQTIVIPFANQIAVGLIAVILVACIPSGNSSGGGSSGGRTAHPAPPGPANPESDFTVQASSDGKGVLITKYTGTASNVVIPATIQGMAVTEIGNAAFDTNTANVTSFYIPESVTKIDKYAFANTRITEFPSSWPRRITTIEEGMFINNRSFIGDLIIPEGITHIGAMAFQYNTNITSVTLPSTIREIGHHAFYNCHSLTTVNIPASVSSINWLPDSATSRNWSFADSNIDLSSQARLRQLGYNDSF